MVRGSAGGEICGVIGGWFSEVSGRATTCLDSGAASGFVCGIWFNLGTRV